MRKFVLTMVMAACSVMVFGQTIDKAPIFKSDNQRLRISELSTPGMCPIYIGHQNPKYQSIVDIVSFTVEDKDALIFLMEECIRVLDMPKTSRDEPIRHKASGVHFTRYGTSQKDIVFNSGLRMRKAMIQQIIDAANSYTYSCEGNN